MANRKPPFPVGLPKNWPRRVRSAVLHVISLAHVSLVTTHGWATHAKNPQVRRQAEVDRLQQEIALLQEELRIKDARMQRVSAQHRPHYVPTERLAILQLRAARGWSLAQAAGRFLVTTATLASWMHRLNEKGPAAIVQTQTPVNKFPDFVRYIVQQLKVLCPSLGQVKIAQLLSRAGLHLGATTVRRMLRNDPHPDEPAGNAKVTANPFPSRYPNHVWHCDLTTVPTSLGFWTSWLPMALPQRWPFCWWVAVVIDPYSRRNMGFAVFRQQPTAFLVRKFIERLIRGAGSTPRHLVTDQDKQFRDHNFRQWCRRREIRQRFGAIGKYGSIAIIKRFIRTTKQECTRRLLVSYVGRSLQRELTLFFTWYNEQRPHNGLLAATPDEVYHGAVPACLQPRFEPRTHWPRGAPCATPDVKIRGRRGVRLELHVDYLAGRKHLPIVTLKHAA